MSVRLIASCFALSAFALALVMGLAAGNDSIITLWRALLAMALCYIVGSVIGHVARIAVNEHIEHYKRENPLPTIEALDNATSAAAENAALQPQDA